MQEHEEWADAFGFEEICEISSLGNVRTKPRIAKNGRKYEQVYLTKVPDRYGYLTVGINRSGKQHRKTIHRLVAKAFCRGSGEIVNHKNGVKTDNRASNLEWCTASENELHAYRTGLKFPPKNTRPGRFHSRFKGFVVATSLETGAEVILEGNTDMVSKGFSQACVSNCLRGKQKSHRGYTFNYLAGNP
ncbi:HNH endonuclease [Serratia ureilytica]|uniref:NUMOD4 motif-containing HNH endonuclease n=1 Tax=Serratia ureilytica TaxID=300181 RepID=UPI0018D8CBA8|nr:NUMOD4 motif-containing HNH endonuclease [Serratia ureilytica]MBH2967524.1 HNH endonuclease [Serratia marcescens]MBN6134486.1 HNH endonuclease [Serratia marcescens]UNE41980.1 HNH endonuclease [Serratia ureilytica]